MTVKSRPQLFYILAATGFLLICFLTECRMVRRITGHRKVRIEQTKPQLIIKPIKVEPIKQDTAKLSGTSTKITPSETKNTDGALSMKPDTLKKDISINEAKHETAKLSVALDNLRDAVIPLKGKDSSSPNLFSCCTPKLVIGPTGKPTVKLMNPEQCRNMYVVSHWWLFALIGGTIVFLLLMRYLYFRNKRKHDLNNKQ
jgi:hypothetical protein